MIDKIVEAVSGSLTGLGILGIILGFIALANITLGTVYNVGVKEKPFEPKKLLFGALKAIIIFIGVGLLTTGVSILPVALEELGLTALVAPQAIEAISNTAIFGLIIGTIIAQGVGAFENLKLLWGAKTAQQKIEENYTVETETEYKED